MDRYGFKTIKSNLNYQGIEDVPITPEPINDTHDVRWLDIKVVDNITPAQLLNALHRTGFMEPPEHLQQGTHVLAYDGCPRLKLVGMMAGCLTFEDMNFGTKRPYWI